MSHIPNPMYPALPEPVVRAGMRHASEKFPDVKIDEDKLVLFYHLSRDKRKQLKREASGTYRERKRKVNFYTACRALLDSQLTVCNREEQDEYDAYLCGIMKMANTYRLLTDSSAKDPQPLDETERVKQYVGLQPGERQFHFILPIGSRMERP